MQLKTQMAKIDCDNAHMDGWANLYMDIKFQLIQDGYSWEIDWQDDLDLEAIDESTFLKEIAWVILSSGMRESVVRNKFDQITKSFLHWESACLIREKSDICYQKAISIFNNRNKIQAILNAASILIDKGIEDIKNDLIEKGPKSLMVFPYIGPVTCYHLAKNIGYSISKPDRHLVRISEIAGFSNSNNFCNEISDITGDKPEVVDVILWRYASLNSDYKSQMSEYF